MDASIIWVVSSRPISLRRYKFVGRCLSVIQREFFSVTWRFSSKTKSEMYNPKPLWGMGSLNIEMDKHTFLTNRERAADYLNSLDKGVLQLGGTEGRGRETRGKIRSSPAP